jgi:hypothetical protein
MNPIAPIGAGAYLAGMGLNTWGQQQGVRAMQNVWADALDRQRGFDRQLNAKQQEALAQINPQSFLGLETTAQLNGQMDESARNAMAAIKGQAGRRKGNAEGKAVAKQRQGGTLAALLRSGKLQATAAGLQKGGQKTREVGAGLGVESRMIGDDARRWAALAPLFEQGAQQKGAWAREMGGMLQGLGQIGIMAGMASPGAGAGGPAGSPTAAATGTYYPGTDGGMIGNTSLGAYDYVGAQPAYGAT